MSWENILKNTTKEAEQLVEDYLTAYDGWFEECSKLYQQELEQIEEGHKSITEIKEKHPEQLNIPAIKDMLEQIRETNNTARQKIYKDMDEHKKLMGSIKTLKEATIGVPIYNLLDVVIKQIPAYSMIPGRGLYPASPSYDLERAEDLLHKLSFEGSGRRDFT